jgi:hypothetical protein
MLRLDFKEIHRKNKASVTRNKLRQQTVSPAKKLKAYEKQTRQSHGRSPSVGGN